MQIKTITTVTGVNEIDFGNDDSQSTAHFYWFKNLSNSTLYVSAMPDPVAGEDNVAELSAKGAASVETDEGKVYVLGAGKVEIHRTNSKFCPFELPSTGSGGGGGGSITVDSELSETSENPLQNKATTAAINEVKSELDTKSDINHVHDITASGNPVTLTNLQGGVPFSEMVVSGKNLLTYPYYHTTHTNNGITFTDNGNGTIAVDGTASSDSAFYLVNKQEIIPSGTSVYLSGCPAGGSGSSYDIVLVTFDENNTAIDVYNDVGNGKYIAVSGNTKTVSVYIRIRKEQVINNLVFRPQLELGSTPTEYEPPITGRELTVNVSGKNLLPFPYAETTKTVNGITFTDNGDGSVTVNGTATGTATFMLKGVILNRGIYTFSGCPVGGSGSTYAMQLAKNDWSFGFVDYGNGTTKQVDETTKLAQARIIIYSGTVCDNIVFRPQLEIGSTATPYEPYHGAEYTITPDSNPYVIPNDIRQQDGYNVVSVSEGELSVTGVRKNAAIKRIWDDMGMDLLFDGVTSADNPAVVDLANYKFVEIHHIMIANEKAYPSNIRLSLDNYLSSTSTIITQIHGSSINTIHTEEGMVSSLYAISAAGSNMNNTKIYGIK